MPGAVIETVSVPKGSTGDSHPVLTTTRGPHVSAPPLPDTGSLPVTQGCFAATLALCTCWPCTGGVKVLSLPTAFLCLPPPPASDTDLAHSAGSRGATLIKGFRARVEKSSFIWSEFSLSMLRGTGLNRWMRRKSWSLEEPSAEQWRRESQWPEPAVLSGIRQAGASPEQHSPAPYLCLLADFFELKHIRKAPPVP